MSEFSESYHLFSTDQNDGVKLLKRAWLQGYVYPASNNWVTILPSGKNFQPNKRLIRSNKSVLVHFVNAEDHGWSISIYDENKRTFHYECTWEDDIEINQDEYNRERMVELINQNPNKLTSVTPLDITKIFYVSDFDDLAERDPVHQIASLLRLEHYEWISFHYVQSEYKENPTEMSNRGIRIIKGLLSF
ncbi:hypothetical protein DFQ01_13021 [Paenibacillus cellulosilyticus]|uniref:Uncharacterized protein n=1 Tax=Paenibacillus cellulosilyticus TaxID=375489 RepID=A0A2V2YLK8_9BACL|nr:hypothetical protein [Paenibacillus cellulosilyticus]PWV94456.1 hypothetical protein DFQ01_13021 [Paenibacillus cellulosilyticus]QKS44975.1 hypothetical protein HUB94_11550 [Paenibacillus cellulosilyticus]